MSTRSPPPPTPGAAASSAVCPSRLPELSVLRSLELGWCPCAWHLLTSQSEPRAPPRRRPPPGPAGQLPDRPSPDSPWETTILDPTWDPCPFVGGSGETAHRTGPRKRPRAEASGTLGAEHPSSVGTGGGGQGGQLRELPFKGAVPPGGWHSASRP